ncbi:MAG: radical SAM protein [Ruminococcus sp.]|nr:radical SAM protein [Ruminococcus sp.]MDE7226529.1 radical SAM protein [Ruminococcus sp.]
MKQNKHANISIFVPHIGCPHRCSFCDQRTISGAQHAPDGNEVREICEKALSEIKSPETAEIAFFGGSFTAVPRRYMTELLESASLFVGDGIFRGIRISTRPDCITPEILDILKKYGVTSIELGAQSMSDTVLSANERGHTAEDVYKASDLIKSYGFELGLQMMFGLYKSSGDDEFETMNRIIEIHPDTVRIYPVVILKNTRLGELYQSGEYQPFCGFDDAVESVASMMETFEENGIKVIKCGLHASEFVEKDMIGGFYHPAFRELCENVIYRHLIWNVLFEMADLNRPQKYDQKETTRKFEKIHGEHIFAVNPSCISKAVGQRKSNIRHFREQGIYIKIIGDENVAEYKAELRR